MHIIVHNCRTQQTAEQFLSSRQSP